MDRSCVEGRRWLEDEKSGGSVRETRLERRGKGEETQLTMEDHNKTTQERSTLQRSLQPSPQQLGKFLPVDPSLPQLPLPTLERWRSFLAVEVVHDGRGWIGGGGLGEKKSPFKDELGDEVEGSVDGKHLKQEEGKSASETTKGARDEREKLEDTNVLENEEETSDEVHCTAVVIWVKSGAVEVGATKTKTVRRRALTPRTSRLKETSDLPGNHRTSFPHFIKPTESLENGLETDSIRGGDSSLVRKQVLNVVLGHDSSVEKRPLDIDGRRGTLKSAGDEVIG